MDKVNGFYEIVKNYKGGLALDLPAFDASLNNRVINIPWDVKKVRVPRAYALGIFTDSTLQRMYEEGYFSVEPAADFKRDVEEIFAPISNKPTIENEDTIRGFLTKGNRVAIKQLIEQNDVNRDNVIVVARENIGSLSTSMVKDLEKMLGVELIIDSEEGDEQ